MELNLMTIIFACILIGGLVYFFPRMPGIAQIIAAIVIVVVCLIALAGLLGVKI